MKLLLENWREFTESSEDPELWGNCGMVAIAIYEEAERRGLDPMLVFVHNADDEDTIMMGNYDLFHVAIAIGDDYYDDRGKISRDDLNFDDFGEKDRDFYVDEFYLNEKTKDVIHRETNWDSCPADFEERSKEIVDKILPDSPKESDSEYEGEVGVGPDGKRRYKMKEEPWQRIATLMSDLMIYRHREGKSTLTREELFADVNEKLKAAKKDHYPTYEAFEKQRQKDMKGYGEWFRGLSSSK